MNKIIDANKTAIFNLSSSKNLAKSVAKTLDIEVSGLELKRFLDGEIYLRLLETVRNKHVFIIHSINSPVNENLMEILILVDALKRASAKEITAIIPYLGYARQDRLSKGREPITSKLVADLLEKAGINRLITFDIHSNQIQGFFNIPTDNIRTLGYLTTAISKAYDLSNAVVLSPDFGSIKRAKVVAKRLGLPIVIVDKRREQQNNVEIDNIIGNLDGKDVLIVDDMIDTGNTLKKTLQLIHEKCNNIYIAATHGVFSLDQTKYQNYDEYFNEFSKIGVKKIFITNSIEQKALSHEILEVLDLSSQIAEVIRLVSGKHGALSDFFNKEWN